MKLSHLKKEIQKFCDKSKDWTCSEDFFIIMKREKNRSYRTGLPVTLISIKFYSEPNKISNTSAIRHLALVKKLIEIISADTRECDIKHLSEKFVIEVLLTHTALDGAKSFTEKISKKLYDQSIADGDRELQDIIKDFKFDLYPLNEISRNNKYE